MSSLLESISLIDYGTALLHYGAPIPIQPAAKASGRDPLADHLHSRMRGLFEERWPSKGEELDVSVEIATFAMEYASNQGYLLTRLVSATTNTNLIALLSDIFTKSRETASIRVEGEAIKRHIRESENTWVRVTLGAALARVPDTLDVAFLHHLREWLPPAGWTYCLYILAQDSSESTRELLRSCLSIEGITSIDRLICSRAVYGADTAALEALSSSEDQAEQMLMVQLCEDGGVDQTNAVRLLVQLVKHTSFKPVKKAAIHAMRCAVSKEAQLTLRTLAQSERDPEMRKQLFEAEQAARNVTSREHNRAARPRERRQFLDVLWSRLS